MKKKRSGKLNNSTHLQEFDTLITQRVPLCTILRYPLRLTYSKNFLQASSAPTFANFERPFLALFGLLASGAENFV